MKIGYLVPQFPGQTHIFFWREIRELKKLGVSPRLISTKLPKKENIVHSWARSAIKQTFYLCSFSVKSAVDACFEILKTGPSAWLRCINSVIDADCFSFLDRLNLIPAVFFGALLAKLAKDDNLSHIHVQSCANCANIALFAHLISGLSYSLTLHNPLRVYGSNQKQKWKNASFAICISKKIKTEVINILQGFVPNSIEFAPMGVDPKYFKRNKQYTVNDGKKTQVIFSCGRLNPCKGFEYLINAIKILHENGHVFRLNIAGGEECENYTKFLKKIINEFGLDNSVTLLGAISEKKVKNELEQASIFVLPSLDEGIPVAIMEAMAMGVPVVSTTGGSIPEIIKNGQNGIIVPPKNSKQLAEVILQVSRNKELAEKFSNAGRRTVLKSFNSKISADVIVKNVKKLKYEKN